MQKSSLVQKYLPTAKQTLASALKLKDSEILQRRSVLNLFSAKVRQDTQTSLGTSLPL